MSTYAIKTFHNDLERLKHFGGTNKETAIRFAFQKLLDEYAKSRDLMLIPEISLKTKSGKTVTPDGTLKDMLRLDHGYWESKDEADDIDEEIRKKFAKNYPNDNILFEDSTTAVLIQHGAEVMRTSMDDEEALDKLLTRFVNFERKEITDFRQAIDKFREDIPKVTETLHDLIEKQFGNQSSSHVTARNEAVYSTTEQSAFITAFNSFHELAKQSINPDITESDVKEMMVQHILSADIFNTIFDEPHFHQENNIARELNKVVDTFFTGATRRSTLASIQHYYQTINAAAAGIADHHEKQKFLKVVYENFYKAYNPKAADRLGIVYTPNEIVQFMIKSTDYLLHKHFGKTLADKNVEILDPATGTGTFICDIIDFLPKNKVEYKYKNELHANELAILPYYIANLNIEYTYKQKTGSYAEFESLCLVDTLDNTGFNWVGKQGDLFGVSAENANRIKKQNQRKISVIIGNPPYNVGQMNENDNNKNREYPEIDKRIKETYIKKSTAQKTKVYDMYARFYRWASDRIMDDGMICFISNNSYLNARTFDGFRKSIQDEFQFAYIIDLGGNIYELSGKDGIFLNEKNTIFGKAAAVGIAIAFFIKDKRYRLNTCKIQYIHPTDIRATRDEKIKFICENKIEDIFFENINPDKNNNWINLADNDFDTLVPMCDKNVKAGKNDFALLRLFSTGINSGRDEWISDFNLDCLSDKMKYYVNQYKSVLEKKHEINSNIKWSRNLKRRLESKKEEDFNPQKINQYSYRPFIKTYLYNSPIFIDERSNSNEIFGEKLDLPNQTIVITGPNSQKPFFCQIINNVGDYHYVGSGSSSQFISLYSYQNGKRIDNITDWGLEQFRQHYGRGAQSDLNTNGSANVQTAASVPAGTTISKEDIFHYVYAVLHHPAYRKKYELNLKREFPRIPFYDDFYQWAQWGKQLMELHINYEEAEPYALKLVTLSPSKGDVPKSKLKADKAAGIIVLDEVTELHGIPALAWEYKLGNRSALEWILDQYKEKKPGDATIAEKFNTYKFADYKEQVIDLLQRVCTVSVETMKVVGEMPE